MSTQSEFISEQIDGLLLVVAGSGGNGDVSIANLLDVTGTVTFRSTLTLVGTGLTTLGGAVTITGLTTHNGAVSITGTNTLTTGTGLVTLGGAVTITGLTTHNGAVSITGTNTLTVGTGLVTLGGQLTVAGNTSITGTATLTTGTGLVTLGGAVTITGLTTHNGAVSITGTNTLTVGTGLVTLGGQLTVAGNTSITGTATFTVGTGLATFGGAVTIAGLTTNNGAVSITGTNTLTTGTGLVSIGGALTVTGVTTLNNTVSIPGSSTLTVGTGLVTLGGQLTVAGNTSITGSATFTVGTGLATFGGAVTIAGLTTHNGAVSITGTNTLTTGTGLVSVGGALTVTGVTTLNNTVSIPGTSTLTVGTGTTTLGGALVVSGFISGPSITNANAQVYIYEDMTQTTVSTLSLAGTTTYLQSNYIQLTPATASQVGFAYTQKDPGSSWTAQFDYYFGGGTGADGAQFFVQQTALPTIRGNSGGWSLCMDEFNNTIVGMSPTQVNTASVGKTSDPLTTWLTTATWSTIVITFTLGTFRVYINNVYVPNLSFSQVPVNQPAGTYMGFVGATGGSTNFHRIRNVRVEKGVGNTVPVFGAPTAWNMPVGSVTIANTNTIANGASDVVNATTGALNVNGDIHLYNAGALPNMLVFGPNPVIGPPSFTTRSLGSRVVLYPSLLGTTYVDTAIGIDSTGVWYTTPSNIFAHTFYGGTTAMLTLTATTVTVNNTTASTSTITGAFVVPGGVGIGGKTFIGGVVSVTDATWATSVGTGCGVFAGGISSAGTNYFGGQTFFTNGTWASSVGTGAVVMSGGFSAVGDCYFGGQNVYTNTTWATSTTTGSIAIGGGIGVAGDSYFGAALKIVGTTTVLSSNAFTTATVGALNVAGDIILTNVTSQLIGFRAVGSAVPAVTTRSLGTKLVLLPAISGTTVDHALGVSATALWLSASGATHTIDFYNVATLKMQIGAGLVAVFPTTTIATNDIAFTATDGALNVAGDLVLSNATSQMIGFAAGGAAAPTLTNRSLGTKLILKPTVNGTQTDTAIGVSATALWLSNGISTGTIDFYNVTTLKMQLNANMLAVLQTTTIGTTDNTYTVADGALNVAGDIVLSNATSQAIGFAASGAGAPAFTNRSVGTKLVLLPAISGTAVDHALGVTATSLWLSASGAAHTVDMYVTNSLKMSLGATTLTLSAGMSLLLPKTTATATLTPTTNGSCGSITTTSLTTAAGAAATITWTNSTITTTSIILFTCFTAGTGIPEPIITAQAAGSATISLRNVSTTAAFNNTVRINFLIV